MKPHLRLHNGWIDMLSGRHGDLIAVFASDNFGDLSRWIKRAKYA